jgi:hypothetical protein
MSGADNAQLFTLIEGDPQPLVDWLSMRVGPSGKAYSA